MAYQGPVNNAAAEKGVSSIPYIGPIIAAFISIGDFTPSNGVNYAWGTGTTTDARHTEGVPPGLVEKRDYYWEYGTWVYSGSMIKKWNLALQLLGNNARNLDPAYLGATPLSQLNGDLVSVQPATYTPNPNLSATQVYVN